MRAGDLVKVLPPFDEAFPDECAVQVVNGTIATLNGGVDFDQVYLTKIGSAPVQAIARTPITKLTFLRRMTAEQRIAIRNEALVDPLLADAMTLLDAAQDISTDDPDTIAFVQYCAFKGLIAATDVSNILA